MDKTIKFFSKKDCEKCDEIKKIMTSKKIKFKNMPIEDVDNLTYLIMNNVGVEEAPVLEYEGRFITNKEGFLKFLNNLNK